MLARRPGGRYGTITAAPNEVSSDVTLGLGERLGPRLRLHRHGQYPEGQSLGLKYGAVGGASVTVPNGRCVRR